jgi:aminoglycoside phosphotransferase (APT) family kinase protein
MMESEVFWYRMMHENTDILCPEVYVSDFSKDIVKSKCFIMQMMEGEPLWAVNFSDNEYENVQKQKIEMLAKIHRIKNDRFGYIQSELHDTWYDALKSMAGNLVKDFTQNVEENLL